MDKSNAVPGIHVLHVSTAQELNANGALRMDFSTFPRLFLQ